MFYTLAQQQYMYEHGPTVGEQRAANARAGEAAAALRDLRVGARRVLRFGQALRPWHRVRPVRRAVAAVAAPAPVRVLTSAR